MKILKIIVAIIIVSVMMAFGWWWFGTQKDTSSKQTIKAVHESSDERMTKGQTDAPIQMIEYVDMMCIDCAKVHQDVTPKIQKQYIDPGKLRYEVRVVSKVHHEDADIAAEGAYCAAEQGKFWSYLDVTYQKLRDSSDTALGLEDVKTFAGSNARTFAEEVGLNVPSWEYCVAQGTYADVIDTHEKTMSSLNAYGTPHSVINDEQYNGAPAYSVFKAVIDAELTKKQEKTS